MSPARRTADRSRRMPGLELQLPGWRRVTASRQGPAGRGRPPSHPGATGLGQMTLPGPAPVNHSGTGNHSCLTREALHAPEAPRALGRPAAAWSDCPRTHSFAGPWDCTGARLLGGVAWRCDPDAVPSRMRHAGSLPLPVDPPGAPCRGVSPHVPQHKLCQVEPWAFPSISCSWPDRCREKPPRCSHFTG